MVKIFLLTLNQLLNKTRIAVILLLAALPVGLGLLVAFFGEESLSFDGGVINYTIDGLIIGGIMPLITMLLATTAFSHEVEDKTLSYLILRPISRWMIVLPKLLATVTISVPLVVVSAVTITIIANGGTQAVLVTGVGLTVGVVVYASIFTWAGLITVRALAFALVYVLLWEGILSSFLAGIRYLSVRGYTLALLNGMDEEAFEVLDMRVIQFPVAIGGAVLVTTVFFGLTVLRLRTMDVP